MKLQEITTDVLHTETIDGNIISFVYNINEGTVDVHHMPKGKDSGGFVKGLGKFMTNPIVMGLAAVYGKKAYKKYQHNKKYVTRLFARSHAEKPYFEKIVNELMRSGHYKKVTVKDVEGGYIWELERKDW